MSRFLGIGASEIAAILGLSRFAGPWSVWREKVERIIGPDQPMPMAEWGHRHEPTIAQKFAEVCPDVTADLITDPGEYTMVWADNDTIPVFCTPDRLVGKAANWRAVLELKCAWYDAAREWDTHIPLGYQAQLQAAMFCCDVDHGFFAVLLNGYDFRWYRADRNERFIASVLMKLARFWTLIQNRTPPEPDFSESTAKALAEHYSKPTDEKIDLPGDFETLDAERELLLAKAAELERRKDGIDNRIKAAIGNATLGVLPSERAGFTWRPNKKGHRTFRRTLLKGEPND